MRKLQPYWFTPSYQAGETAPVEFELKPLDLEALYTLQASIGATGVPSWIGVKAAFESGVIGWRNVVADGAPLEYSRKAATAILRDIGSANWMIWLGQIAGELLRNAFLTDDEKKT
jgi:hypothetical protein